MRIPGLVVFALVGAVALSAATAAAELPVGPATGRANLWQVYFVSLIGLKFSHTVKVCMDSALERRISDLVNVKSDISCTERTLRSTATGWLFKSVCRDRGSTITTIGTGTGDIHLAYHYDAISKIVPPIVPGMGETHSHMDAKRLGPCPAVLKPGDLIQADGKVINVAPGAH
jgi:hypothetical protein